MRGNNLHAVMTSKRAILFDLFHTLTALESTWSRGLMTYQMLGVSKEAWNEQLQEKSRERLAGEEKDPVTFIKKMAHAIDPAILQETVEAAVKNRLERFAGALINVPEETLRVLGILKGKGKKLGLVSNADVTEMAAWDQSPMSPLFDNVIFSWLDWSSRRKRFIRCAWMLFR